MSISRRAARGRARMMVLAVLACFSASGVFLSAVFRHISVPERVAEAREAVNAETGCVSKPLGWDPHLDWSAGPPC